MEMQKESERFFADLDRCQHGRHAADPCFSCPGGRSAGNRFLRPGQRVGTTVHGAPLCVPQAGDLRDPQVWRGSPQEPDGDRFIRRETLLALLSRMQRGVLLEGEKNLLRAHVEAEVTEAEAGRTPAPWAQTVHTEDGGRTFTLPGLGIDGSEAGGITVQAGDLEILRDMISGVIAEAGD